MFFLTLSGATHASKVIRDFGGHGARFPRIRMHGGEYEDDERDDNLGQTDVPNPRKCPRSRPVVHAGKCPHGREKRATVWWIFRSRTSVVLCASDQTSSNQIGGRAIG